MAQLATLQLEISEDFDGLKLDDLTAEVKITNMKAPCPCRGPAVVDARCCNLDLRLAVSILPASEYSIMLPIFTVK